jgi:methyl coenzyme M reductase subunit D
MTNTKKLKELKIVAKRLLQNFTVERMDNFISRFEEVTKTTIDGTSRISVVIIQNLAKDVLKIYGSSKL